VKIQRREGPVGMGASYQCIPDAASLQLVIVLVALPIELTLRYDER
jgi:hypothetical protein